MSLMTVGAIALTVYGSTTAFFTDTETSTDNTLVAGRLDLKVNSQDNPGVLVNIEDLKPGDEYQVEKQLFVDDNPAKVYLHIKDLQPSQGEQTEPEIEEEIAMDGAPSQVLQDYIYYDLSVDGSAVITLNHQVTLSEVSSCWIPLGMVPGATSIIQSFHLPETITNWAQGDALTFTEEFYAIQERNNNEPPPETGSEAVWDSEQKKCITILFEENFEDSDGYTRGGNYDRSWIYWDIAPLGGTASVPSNFIQGGSQSGNIFYGSFGKDFSENLSPTMTINLPDLSGYTNLHLVVSLAAADTSRTSWEITHRDSLIINGNTGVIDSFLPFSAVSNLRSQINPTDLHYDFQNFEYPIDSSLNAITFTFASTAADEVVGIDSVKIIGN